MRSFTFNIPTKVVFGQCVIEKLGKEASKYGKKALLVYGKDSVKKYGTYDKVMDALKGAEIDVVEYSGVKANPVTSHAREGIKIAKEQGIEMVVAVGGGSVLDEAKSIAAGAVVDHDVWDFFDGTAPARKALPILTILTMPATGSEMNNGMVLTNDDTNVKNAAFSPAVYPKASFLDPEVTYTIPVKNTAFAVSDIMSHLLEGYFTTKESFIPIQDGYVEGLVKGVMQAMERVADNPEDFDGRAAIMWCASLAWNGLGNAGVRGANTPSHMLEHPLSALYDVAHGAGLSITTPAWLKAMKNEIPARIEKFAENIMGITEGTQEEKIDNAIAALEAWYKKVGTPTTLAEAGIENFDVDEVVKHALVLCKAWGLKNYDEESLKAIYAMC